MPERQFWILSFFAHCWLLIVVLFMFPLEENAGISSVSPVFGVLLALGLSVVGAFSCDTEVIEELLEDGA
jgi:predicted ABC-type exoprotein transport system permease subunit